MKIRNPLGVLSSEVATGNLLWVDQINGNDALASRGRLTIPFKTLTAAKLAAVPGTADQPGDTIIVLPGKYNEKDLLRDRVNWHFLNGALVKYEGTEAGAIFDTSAGVVNCAVTGFGIFENHANTSSGYVINSATSSNLLIQARSLYSYYKTCIRISSSGGTLDVTVAESITSPADTTIYQTGTSDNNIIRAHLVSSSSPTCLMIGAGSVDLTAYRISAVATGSAGAIHIAGGSKITVVRAYEITSSNAPTVNYGDTGGTAKLNIIGARIKAAGSGANGRTIMFSAAASDVVRLANCFLIASGDYSIYSDTANTRVHLINGTAANKDKNTNISYIGGDWNYNPNLIA